MSHEPDEALTGPALEAAGRADVCVVFAGLPPSYESEGFDRQHMRLPPQQDALIAEIVRLCPKVVVVLQNGSPVEMPWAGDVSAILEAYLGGQAAGGAIVDILFGKANPCARLSETFPLKLEDNPSYLFYPGEGDVSEYREGIFVGYRYYDRKNADVLFPFGHGLSYTRFEYSNLRLSRNAIQDSETIGVSVDVTNAGDMAGKEIIQVYAGKQEQDIVLRPVRELKGFEAVFLQPGETKTVTVTLGKRAFAYWNTTLRDWHVETGEYRIEIGRSSRDIALAASLSVESTAAVPLRVTLETCAADVVRLPGGREFVDALMKRHPLGHLLDSGHKAKDAATEAMEKMVRSGLETDPMRIFVRYAPGVRDKHEFQALLDKTFNT
jgi:beta-glucosidase